MKTGAVALIDALGFRGIWGRHDPEMVISTLNELRNWFHERVRQQFETQPVYNCELTFLSDTIAVSMEFSPKGHTSEAHTILSLQDVISWVLERSLRSGMPFAYRGAIAFGSYHLSEHFLIGKAVDDAAEAHQMAQGALIWLTPQSLNLVEKWFQTHPGGTQMVRFNTPLKDGSNFNSYTVSPLMHAKDAADAQVLARTLVDTFGTGSNIGVAIKRQHTVNHLHDCYAAFCAVRSYIDPPALSL